jgi:hypothetical protein
MTFQTKEKLESALYRMAKRNGFSLQKCRNRNPQLLDYGIYRLIDKCTKFVRFMRASLVVIHHGAFAKGSSVVRVDHAEILCITSVYS